MPPGVNCPAPAVPTVTCQPVQLIDGGGGSVKSCENKQRNLEVRFLRSQMIEEEYALYKKYQMSIHGDSESECSKSGYRNFLVSSPMPYVTRLEDRSAPECGYGAFHVQYLLDGKLIAVGVIDILPRCLSSKYTFWDPDYAFLGLGKITALKEIEWVKEACEKSPKLRYYCMGYYIHKCQKMAYKGDYAPSELLCPGTHHWVHLTKRVRMALDEKDYCVLDDLSDSPPGPNEGYEYEVDHMDIGDQLVVLDEIELHWKEARSIIASSAPVAHIENVIRQWRRKVGGKAREMVYHIY